MKTKPKLTGEDHMKPFKIAGFLLAILFALNASAIEYFDYNKKVIGQANKVDCMSGLSCVQVGSHMQMLGTTGSATAPGTIFHAWMPAAFTSGTSTAGVATTLYLTQIYIPYNVTLTGISVANAATVGTNKYIVALFNSSGAPVANSATAGVLTAGASGYQAVAFTATYSVILPGTYWIGVYINGTTDTLYTMPAAAAIGGLAGTATSVFGTVAAVTLPTTFTAASGPIAFTY